MKKTMVRRVRDDFEALMMCNAMESQGGEPFSVVLERREDQFGPQSTWHVFGRVEEACFDSVDKVFEHLLTK